MDRSPPIRRRAAACSGGTATAAASTPGPRAGGSRSVNLSRFTTLQRMSEIAPSYVDVWQREHRLDPETRRALEEALGPRLPPKRVAVEKGPCYQPELLAKGGRVWGFMVQLYGVRSQRNWGVGDFGDLGALVELAATLGAGVVGVNPLHAAQVSPYSPSSRHALNAIYLDIEAIPEFANCAGARRLTQSRPFLARLLQLRKSERVDYDGVRTAKHEVLELLTPS